MAEKKISELVGLTSVSGGAILPIVAGDTTYKVGVEQLTGYTQQLIRANITGSNTFTATQNFDGAVFLNGDVTFGGDLTATPITKLNEFTSSVDTNLYSKTLVSSSAQISSNISGSFTQLSESLASRLDAIPATQPGIVSSSVQIVEYGFTQTSSFNSYTSSLNQSTESVIRNEQTSSFALTGSENIFYANQTITGSLGVNNIFLNSSSIYLNSNEVLYRSSMGGNSNMYLHSYDSDGLILAVDGKQWQLTTDGNIITSDGGSDIENSNGIKVFNSLSKIHTYTGSIQREEISGLEAYTSSLKGAIEISGQNVNVLGMITAQQFNVTYVSSSTMYQSGSTKFGDTNDDKHEFTGSVDITGSFLLAGRLGANFGTNNLYMGASSGQLAPVDTTSYNTSVGVNSFANLSVGSLNTVVGAGALSSQQFNINRNVAIGTNVGSNVSDSSAGNILVGYEAGPSDSISINDRLYINNKVSNTPLIYGEFTNTPFVTINGGLNVTSSLVVTGSVEAVNLTGSLLSTNGVVSSSTQITNYHKFAETASANTFYGNQTIAASANGQTLLQGNIVRIIANNNNSENFLQYLLTNTDGSKQSVFGFIPDGTTLLSAPTGRLKLISSTLIEMTGSISVNSSLEAVSLTGSLLSTNGVVSSSNQLFELNEQTGSQDSINLGISIVTGSLNEQTGSQDGVNFGISVFTSSIRNEVNGIEAYTASLKSAFTVIESMVDFNSSITASVVSSSYVKFDSLPNGLAPSYQEGLLYYDNDMGALTFYNDEADISLQIGQESYVRAINVSGDDILNGTPVRVSGSQGDRVKIYKAEAFIHTGSYNDSEAHNHILGIATHDILDTETGYITISGLVKGINTDIYEAGDILYVQTGSAGVLTNVAPPFPYDKIQVGIVGRKHATVGEVLVLPKEPTHFGNITGLSGSATTEVGDLWVYKSNNAWATSKTLEGDYIITGSTTINNVLKLEAADSLLSTGVEAGMIMASASYGFTNLYMYDGSEWKWLVTGSIS